MDLKQVIQELVKERNRLNLLIRALEQGLDAPASKPHSSRRGRKGTTAPPPESGAPEPGGE